MASTEHFYDNRNHNHHHNPPTPGTGHHSRSKSSVLRSFISHRRNGPSSTSGPLHHPSSTNPSQTPTSSSSSYLSPYAPANHPDFALDMGASGYGRDPRPLSELQQNQNQNQNYHYQQGLAPPPSLTLPLSPAANSPSKSRRGPPPHDSQRSSPTKSSGGGGGLSALSLRSLAAARETAKLSKPRAGEEGGASAPSSPTKPKKAKSSTNIAGLLLRPRGPKSPSKPPKPAAEPATAPAYQTRGQPAKSKDKENRTPPSSLGSDHAPPPPPIFAQFATSQSPRTAPSSPAGGGPADPFFNPPRVSASGSGSGSAVTGDNNLGEGIVMKQRPKSFQPPYVTRADNDSGVVMNTDGRSQRPGNGGEDGRSDTQKKRQTWARAGGGTQRSGGLFGAFSGQGTKSSASSTSTSASASVSASVSAAAAPEQPPPIDPRDVDKHLEAMLDRRNIPENQRYKMRNLAESIKMEFIRQDWAETRAARAEQQQQQSGAANGGGGGGGSNGGGSGGSGGTQTDDPNATAGADVATSKKKKHRSLTLSRGVVVGLPSPTKKLKPEGTLGRHFRSKSTDDVTGDRPVSSASLSGVGGGGGGLFAKFKGQQQGPLDFVSYLRTVRQPESVEVGRLHKLRILLRNETVAWTEEFIRQGGMKEIVGLLHRITEVEWREEHEDALLHENLLCLKALCTTALALEYLHSIQATLLPALLHMIFDPEKKGPSEFTTRGIITSLLLTYVESAAPAERPLRAQTVLGYLRDPQGPEENRPVHFVLEMRRERPYRTWCKEVVSITKEVFWIFLHNLNVVALPAATTTSQNPGDHLDYMARHFPRQRPPVPAAPYVGGVEWEATNYLASHLDLLNAIVACTGPTARERNALRAELRISGWERCLGGSLRLCKEKFYGAVHDGLRTWAAAAAEDAWDVRDVRYGPAPESRGASPKKKSAAAAAAKNKEAPPRLDMPKLGLGLDSNSNKVNK